MGVDIVEDARRAVFESETPKEKIERSFAWAANVLDTNPSQETIQRFYRLFKTYWLPELPVRDWDTVDRHMKEILGLS